MTAIHSAGVAELVIWMVPPPCTASKISFDAAGGLKVVVETIGFAAAVAPLIEALFLDATALLVPLLPYASELADLTTNPEVARVIAVPVVLVRSPSWKY